MTNGFDAWEIDLWFYYRNVRLIGLTDVDDGSIFTYFALFLTVRV